jgi:N-acetyl-alpha-D-muramate 1-phosphate uridylyltransferase
MKAQAMVLAAGRGERMRPLTDTTPKPLLRVRGKPLMQWPLEALARGGFADVLINTAWLGDQIEQTFGAVFSPNVSLIYSPEGRDFGTALETAGGIARALPQLDEVFWVLAGDVFAPDFEFTQAAVEQFTASGKLAHLWLVPNPDHNPRGDFGLSHEGLALNLPKDTGHAMYTYSTIGLYRKAFFEPPFCDIPVGNPLGVKAPLVPLMRAAIDVGQVSAEIYTRQWTDVGTPERLQFLNSGENTP